MPYFMSRLTRHPSLQRYTWRIGVVLTGLFLSELNETFTIGLKYFSKQLALSFRTLRNQPVLQDSRKTLGGQVESCCPFNAQIFMKFSPNILGTNMDLLTPQGGCQEPPCPPRLQEVTWRIGGFLTQFLTMDLDETFTEGLD